MNLIWLKRLKTFFASAIEKLNSTCHIDRILSDTFGGANARVEAALDEAVLLATQQTVSTRFG